MVKKKLVRAADQTAPLATLPLIAVTLPVIDYVEASLRQQLSLEPQLRLKRPAESRAGGDPCATNEQIQAALDQVVRLKLIR